MDSKKIVGIIVLLLIIAGVIVVIVRGQSRKDRPPDRVLAQQEKMISAAAPYETREFTTGQIMDAKVDPETGYKMIDGKKWAGVIVCASCGKEIPAAPHKVGSDEPLKLGQYKCPRCNGPAYGTD